MYRWAIPHMKWFSATFGTRIDHHLKSTPYSRNFLVAIAMQETGYVWGGLRKRVSDETELLELMVLDTYGWTKNRSAFPASKKELLSWPDGDRMFKVARRALKKIAAERPSLITYANMTPQQIMFGYGIFQYDLQFFRNDPDYFLNKGWADFDICISKAIHEFDDAVKSLEFDSTKQLSDEELVRVGIVYNLGFRRYNPRGGVDQGHPNSQTGIRYGRYVQEYLRLANQNI